MRKLFALLMVFFLFFFAYNAYTCHQLSSMEGAYKLAGIPGDNNRSPNIKCRRQFAGKLKGIKH